MGVNLFILGRPGSGKSTAARDISQLAEKHGWLAFHMDDYSVLYQMFKEDIDQQRFLPALYGGFDITDFSVFNESLTELARRIRTLTQPLGKEKLVIIEFAPADYRSALELFAHEIQNNAYFLMLSAELNTCIQRKSAAFIPSEDNHYVSEESMRAYYFHDDILNIKSFLETDYGVAHDRIKIIDNTGSSMVFFKEIVRFAEYILKRETIETEKLHNIPVPISIHEPDQEAVISQETEPIPAVILLDEPIEL